MAQEKGSSKRGSCLNHFEKTFDRPTKKPSDNVEEICKRIPHHTILDFRDALPKVRIVEHDLDKIRITMTQINR